MNESINQSINADALVRRTVISINKYESQPAQFRSSAALPKPHTPRLLVRLHAMDQELE